jgi:2-oxoglutarate dehydrogenase E2 component (dihydrolipoamide succinyltransferase)
MARIEMVMPKLGESIMEATIINWSKKPGDKIEAEETVLEIATDKVDSEVPSPAAGVLQELLFKDGDVVPVGTVIAIIESEGVGAAAAPAAPSPSVAAEAVLASAIATPFASTAQFAQQKVESIQQGTPGISTLLTGVLLAEPVRGRLYSPLVLNIAREEGIGSDELDRVPGTGNEGRVTKKDILDYVNLRKAAPAAAVTAPAVATAQTTAPVYSSAPTNGSATTTAAPAKKTFSFNGPTEIIEMDRMRKMIAENMVYSKHTAPHVTSFVEADVTNLVLWRERVKRDFEKRYNQKLTFTPLFLEAVAKALRQYPLVNSSVDGDKIIRKLDINIGVAVALPTGNLIVPVVRKADQLNLVGLAAATNDLVNRARINKLTPDDLSDGTYTVSNVGTFGNVMGTPIILQPQVAVLATGAIKKKPAVIETEAGDFIGVRHMMFLSHSYDHRIIDGALGGQFVRHVGDILENWDLSRDI